MSRCGARGARARAARRSPEPYRGDMATLRVAPRSASCECAPERRDVFSPGCPGRLLAAGRGGSRRRAAPAGSGRCSRRSCWPPSLRAGRRRGRRPRASPSCSIASCAVVAAGRPERLALETASGPVRRSRSRATSSSGSRTATVPSASPRSQARDGACSSTRVSPPGQNACASWCATGGRFTTSPASVEASPISTGTGIVRPRFLAASSPVTADGRERVGGHAVDGVGRQQHQLAPRRSRRRRRRGRRRARRGRCSRRGQPRGSSLPHGRFSGRRAVVKRGRPARSGWSSTSVEGPVRADEAGSALALLVGVLDAQPPAGVQQPGGDGQHPADDVEPVRARPRARAAGRGRPPRAAARRRRARRAGWRRRRRPGRRARDSSCRVGHVAGDDADGRVTRRHPGHGVVPGPLDGAGIALDGGDPGTRVLVRDRQRDGAGAAAEVDDDRRRRDRPAAPAPSRSAARSPAGARRRRGRRRAPGGGRPPGR